MKPLQELLKGKVVNCQTEEEAKEFLELLCKNGCTLFIGNEKSDNTYWRRYRNETGYYLDTYNIITFASVVWYKQHDYEIITYQQFKQLINENNMETKEVKIQVPEGYEIDKKNSTFDCIKFKPIKKVLTYEDVAKELFKDNPFYYRFGTLGEIQKVPNLSNGEEIYHCMSEKQAKKLLAINKLINVAKYLDGDWYDDWEEHNDGIKWYINIRRESIEINFTTYYNRLFVHFKSKESAQQAIEILGEETIRLALSTDW